MNAAFPQEPGRTWPTAPETTTEGVRSELGRALVAWRLRKGTSRLAAARILGVAHTTLRSWEVEGVCPQPLQLQALAAVVDLDLEFLRSMAGADRVRTARTSGGAGAAPLCRARLAVGLTMTQLARKLGVDPSTVSRWENGVRTPPPELLPRLADALRVTPEQLGGMLATSPPRRSDGAVLPGLGRLRMERGFTQREFRAAVGIGPTTVNAWECGRVRVPADRLATVAAVLGLDRDTLLALATPPPPARTDERPLVALRRAAGVSQRELAHYVGASIRTVAHWEAGTRPVPLAAVRPMARCLRCPVRTVLAAARLQLPRVPHPATWTPADLPGVLAVLRRSSGWSAADVGRRVGVPGRTVRGWETGAARPPAAMAQRLESIYEVSRGRLGRLVAEPVDSAAVQRAG
ncbi:MAG: helix-turn-helix protein [Blastococcus sp.]|nr:helix-turn-helix protein [Blastococcus sp.]